MCMELICYKCTIILHVICVFLRCPVALCVKEFLRFSMPLRTSYTSKKRKMLIASVCWGVWQKRKIVLICCVVQMAVMPKYPGLGTWPDASSFTQTRGILTKRHFWKHHYHKGVYATPQRSANLYNAFINICSRELKWGKYNQSHQWHVINITCILVRAFYCPLPNELICGERFILLSTESLDA